MSIKRVEICGNIASGKTTLCSLLSTQGRRAIFERFESNPFFQQFYNDPAGVAFETEITFLLQHYNAIKEAARYKPFICDFSLTQDIAYSDINLYGNRLDLFQNIAEELRSEIGYPRTLIHIDCPEDELQRRIILRSRKEESSISREYLSKLRNAISLRANEARQYTNVVTIDSSTLSFDALLTHPALSPALFND